MPASITSTSVAWAWTRPVAIETDEVGVGPTILFLPAPSSISTRKEMLPLMRGLADRYRTVSVDLPGFGAAPKPAIDWTPAAYRQFVGDTLDRIKPAQAVIAAGHAATYALRAIHDAPGRAGRLIMIAPTWRGPLPTVFGSRPGLYGSLRRAGDVRGLGAGLYRLNANGPMLRMMTTGHVYSDRQWLSGARMAEKLAVIDAEGARHAAIRFVTGGLDPLSSRKAWLDLIAAAPCPIQIIYGAETPRRTRAEIEAAAGLPNVAVAILPKGKLGLHEEFPDDVAARVRTFIGPA